MVSWVIVAVVVIAFLIYAKHTGFRYGRVMTMTIAGSLIFFAGTFIFVVVKAGLVQNLDSYNGFVTGIRTYFFWLGNFFTATGDITGNVIKSYASNVTNFSR
jgi:hypothetical protein